MPKEPLGGTQLINNYLHKHLKLDGFHIWPTTFDDKDIDPNVINIYHQHLEASLETMPTIFTEERMALMDAIVFISHWQFEDYIIQYPWLDTSKCSIIKNATNAFPIPWQHKQRDGKLKMIYTSTPFRGLEHVPEIWRRLDRDDVELDVYSSLEIYGQGFVDKVHQEMGSKYEDLFEELDSIDGINYKGYVPNDEIRQACMRAHIYMYPAIVMETSCLSLMEGLAGGCASVVTSIGALPETGSEFAYYSLMDFNDDRLIDNYTKQLDRVCNDYWTQPVQDKLREQYNFYLHHYNWDLRIKEWKLLLLDLQTLSKDKN